MNIDSNSLIVKSNKLIEAKMKFSGNEYKLITFLAGQIDIDKAEFNSFEIRIKDLNEKCFKNSQRTKGTYNYVRNKYAYSLAKKNITILKNEKDIIIFNWFSVIETAKSTLKVCFNDRLKDFLLNNTKNFTSYKLANILALDTFYEIRIYEILKQYEKIGKREISMFDLKFMLGIEKNQIKRFSDFKERVLNKAINKINEKTDIKVKYDFDKSTDIKFKFWIIGKNTYRSKEIIEIKEAIEKVIKAKVDINILSSTMKKYNIKKDDIHYYLDNWDRFSYKKIDNPVGFLFKCVVDKIELPVNQISINKPAQSNNFDQRKYDDEFFESLYDNLG